MARQARAIWPVRRTLSCTILMAASPFMRHLGVVLAIKLVLLAALWLVFVRCERVAVDPAAMAERAGLRMSDVQSPRGEHRE